MHSGIYVLYGYLPKSQAHITQASIWADKDILPYGKDEHAELKVWLKMRPHCSKSKIVSCKSQSNVQTVLS